MNRRLIRTVCFGIVFLVIPCSAEDQADSNRDWEFESAIIAELEALSPESVEDFEAATTAYDQDDFAAAVEGYRKVIADAPEFDHAFRRLCYSLVELGNIKEGIAQAEKAVEIHRSPINLFALARAIAFPGDEHPPPSPDAVQFAYGLAREAAKADPGEAAFTILRAELAMQCENAPGFRESVNLLLEHHSEQMITHYFAAVLAVYNEEWTKAEHHIREAGLRGLPEDVVDEFLADGIGARVAAWRWAKIAGIVTGAWAMGLALLFFAGKALSSIILASVERDDPNTEISDGTKKLRSIYRRLVTAAGLYWYISQPFVALLVIAITGSVIYGFLMIGRIPVKLAAIIVCGALVTLYAMVRSLFVRISDDDPGTFITEEDAPGLWAMAKDVAAEVGTRPVDEIWLTTGTELGVYERGGLQARMSDRARRALLLGAGILEGFEQNAFQAVLAHEYGHFSHRDTAGGEVAMRVQSGMYKFVIALAEAGYAVWWNLAFLFLRLYSILFRRISHGATRLQELLADRIAIQRYGLQAFKDGLTHVIRRGITFSYVFKAEIENAVEARRPISNLYALPEPSDPELVETIESEIKEALEARTDEDDTHPAPMDRFRLGAQIRSTSQPERTGSVMELFADGPALMQVLSAEITNGLNSQIDIDTEIEPGSNAAEPGADSEESKQ